MASPSVSTDDSLDQTVCNIAERKSSAVDRGPTKMNLFDEEESSSSEDESEDGGAQLDNSSSAFKINEEYARRFEHNKKREERQRLEEKYGPISANGDGNNVDEESNSSEDDDEDEAGFLATEDLDAEISATLQAIKNKDPRIYDKDSTFYRPIEETLPAKPKDGKEKPVFLKDYHRERYMKGDVGADFGEDSRAGPPPRTYAEEQDDIKKSILDEINALEKGDADADTDEGSDGDGFIKRKAGQEAPATGGVHPSRASRVKITESDVANADKDPELFLSNFMASRAWAPAEGLQSQWQAFESDEGEDDNMAEEFENAYNMRFEDPEKSNEVLKSYSRTLVAARSVRRDDKTGRKKQRELEKERKEAEKQERREERARLRKLKIEETEEKLKKIKEAAGLRGKSLGEEELATLLEDAWDNDKWEEEMLKRFGDNYYAEEDRGASSDEEGRASSKKKKPKKPNWDDDIDIKDIVPDFDDSIPPTVALSGSEGEAGPDEGDEEGGDDEEDDENPAKKRKTSKDHKKDRMAAKRAARLERSRVEALVDTQMELDDPTALASASSPSKNKEHNIGEGSSSKGSKAPAFRYRETSPNSFGLTARDILLAPSDAALNEYVGIKKLATFRDPEKKRMDKKRLGKKARLRQWRRDNFGKDYEHSGPTFGFEQVVDAEAAGGKPAGHSGHLRGDGKSKGKGKDKGKGKEKEQHTDKAEGEGEGRSHKRERSRGTKASA